MSISSNPFDLLVVVRSFTSENATVRLQSNPLLSGAKSSESITAIVCNPEAGLNFPDSPQTCIVFHYNDVSAVDYLRRNTKDDHKYTIICLGSDIYSFERYISVHNFTDIYMVPTDHHRKILSQQVYKPVYVLPETIDSTVLNNKNPTTSVRLDISTSQKKLVWFGYPESFYKSMLSLIPIIQSALKQDRIDEFHIISNKKDFLEKHDTDFGFKIIEFDESRFLETIQGYNYAILSHFALDLSLNSHIKSPNKLITALVAGLVPIVSDTPSYRDLCLLCGLDRLLFSSPLELNEILNNLDPASDQHLIQSSGATSKINSLYCDNRIFSELSRIVGNYRSRKSGESFDEFTPHSFEESANLVGFSAHLSDLIPSAIRALESRRNRLARIAWPWRSQRPS